MTGVYCENSDGAPLSANYKIKLEINGDYGGHGDHAHEPQPIGQIEFNGQKSGDFKPQGANGSSTDTTPEIDSTLGAGVTTDLKLTFPEASEEALLTFWTNCDESELATDLTYKFHFKLMMNVPFVRLENMISTNGVSTLVIERSTNSHGDSAGYGSTLLESNLQTFNERMDTCLPTGMTNSLTITAASLIHGGLYDIQYSWKSPHKNHRIGNDADIGLSAINQNQQKLVCVENARMFAGLASPVPSERIEKDGSGNFYVTGAHDHMHLTATGNHFYPLDESSLW